MSRVVSCAITVVVLLMIGCVDRSTESTTRDVLLACDPTLQCYDGDSSEGGPPEERYACPCVMAFPDVLVPGTDFTSPPSDSRVVTAPAVLPIGGIARDPIASVTCDQRVDVQFCIQVTEASGVGQLCSKALDCFPGVGLDLSIIMPPFGPIIDAMTMFKLIITAGVDGRGLRVIGVRIPVAHQG